MASDTDLGIKTYALALPALFVFFPLLVDGIAEAIFNFIAQGIMNGLFTVPTRLVADNLGPLLYFTSPSRRGAMIAMWLKSAGLFTVILTITGTSFLIGMQLFPHAPDADPYRFAERAFGATILLFLSMPSRMGGFDMFYWVSEIIEVIGTFLYDGGYDFLINTHKDPEVGTCLYGSHGKPSAFMYAENEWVTMKYGGVSQHLEDSVRDSNWQYGYDKYSYGEPGSWQSSWDQFSQKLRDAEAACVTDGGFKSGAKYVLKRIGVGAGLAAAILIIVIGTGLWVTILTTVLGFLILLAMRMLLIYAGFGLFPVLLAFWVVDIGPAEYANMVAEIVFKLLSVLYAFGIVISGILGVGDAIASSPSGGLLFKLFAYFGSLWLAMAVTGSALSVTTSTVSMGGGVVRSAAGGGGGGDGGGDGGGGDGGGGRRRRGDDEYDDDGAGGSDNRSPSTPHGGPGEDANPSLSQRAGNVGARMGRSVNTATAGKAGEVKDRVASSGAADAARTVGSGMKEAYQDLPEQIDEEATDAMREGADNWEEGLSDGNWKRMAGGAAEYAGGAAMKGLNAAATKPAGFAKAAGGTYMEMARQDNLRQMGGVAADAANRHVDVGREGPNGPGLDPKRVRRGRKLNQQRTQSGSGSTMDQFRNDDGSLKDRAGAGPRRMPQAPYDNESAVDATDHAYAEGMDPEQVPGGGDDQPGAGGEGHAYAEGIDPDQVDIDHSGARSGSTPGEMPDRTSVDATDHAYAEGMDPDTVPGSDGSDGAGASGHTAAEGLDSSVSYGFNENSDVGSSATTGGSGGEVPDPGTPDRSSRREDQVGGYTDELEDGKE